MIDEHLKPTCVHCGVQGTHDCDPAVRSYGQHASDREDYLVEECAVAEVNAEWWRGWAGHYHAAMTKAWQERDALQARLRLHEEASNVVNIDCQGDEPRAWELAYQVERKRARKWKRRAFLNAEKSRAWVRVCKACPAEDERDEARAALEAMTARARGMREAMLEVSFWYAEKQLSRAGKTVRDAAGEPIP